MDPLLKRVLLEVLDLERSQYPSALCGFSWCEGVLIGRPIPCEHLPKCRLNHAIYERIEELKIEVNQAEADEYLEIAT